MYVVMREWNYVWCMSFRIISMFIYRPRVAKSTYTSNELIPKCQCCARPFSVNSSRIGVAWVRIVSSPAFNNKRKGHCYQVSNLRTVCTYVLNRDLASTTTPLILNIQIANGQLLVKIRDEKS